MKAESMNRVLTKRWHLATQLRSALWPYRWSMVAVLCLILSTSLLEGFSFSLIVPVMQAFTYNPVGQISETVFPVYQKWLAGYTIEGRLAILGLVVMVLFGLKNVLQYFREMLTTSLWLGLGTEIRLNVLGLILDRPYCFFLDRKKGSLVQQLYYEPYHVGFAIQVGIEQLANLISLLALIAVLVLVSWQVTISILMIGAVYSVAIWRISKRVHAGGNERQRVEAEAVSLLTEAVGGIRQIKVFSAEHRVQEAYEELVQLFRDLQTRYRIAGLIPHRVTELFWIAVLGLLLCLPVLGLVKDFQTVIPVVAVFSAVVFRAGPYVSRISQGWLTLKFYHPAFQTVAQMMEISAEQIESRASGKPQRLPFQKLLRDSRFTNVSFSYGETYDVLCNVSVVFRRGETTAIIGPSGSGKSTLVDLLIGLYEPSSGRILADGVDLRDYDRASWLAAIGFVSQDTFIFHGTIRDNIAFSKPGAVLEEVQSAARQANADEFIKRAPQGYDTVVGDRGLKLSGGERQRIAIARALIRDPQILIFDEATSALDNQSEALVQEAISRIARDRTVILIAHRLSSIIQADKIIVLEGGKVMEEGTHASLMKGGGTYATLYGRELARETV